MKFEELLEMDTYGAFDDYVTVKEAKSSGLIPEDYNNIFEDKCSCGSERIISKNLAHLECCNPRCYIKLGYMLSELFSRFGCLNMGPATCLSIMYGYRNDLEKPSHVEILGLNEVPYVIDNGRVDDYIRAIEVIRSKRLTLPELVGHLGIPKIDKIANKIFQGYSTIGELCEELDNNGGFKAMPAFLLQRGIEDRKVWFYMRHFFWDMIKACVILGDVLRPLAFNEIQIVITGSVSPYGNKATKNEFIDLLNDAGTLPNGQRLLGFKNSSAIASVPIVVADYPSGNRKYVKAKEREEYEGKVVYTSTELMEWIKSQIEPYVTQIEEGKDDKGETDKSEDIG